MERAEYATREPTYEERHALREAIFAAAREYAFALEPEDAPLAELGDETQPETEQRRTALAMVHALTAAARAIEHPLIKDAAHDAGQAGASYSDIGAAAGMSRQAARSRWPGAVHARPGRPPLPPTTTERSVMDETPWPEGTPCEVWYPPAGADPQNRDTWAWLPGTIGERIGPDEWAIEVDAAAHPELVTLADGTPAPPGTDEDLVYPVCFRDRTEIRPRH